MRWTDIETGLVDVIRVAAGDVPTHWTKVASAYRAAVTVRLDVLWVRAVGDSETRLDYDEDADAFTEALYANRVLGVQVAVETQSQKLGRSGYAIAERIRSRLAFESTRDALHELGLSVASTGNVMDTTYRDEEGRSVSLAAFELALNTVSFEVSDTKVDRIVEVVIDAEVRRPETGADEPPDYVLPVVVADD